MMTLYDELIQEGMDKGLEMGLEKGREEGRQSLILTVLRHFRRQMKEDAPFDVQQRVETMTYDQLEQLNEAL